MNDKKKKINKKAIEYVRPEPGIFDLKAFPGIEFKFRKIWIDDEAWINQTFNKNVWEMMNNSAASSADLCRMYFNFLTDESKLHFPPEKVEELNYETGEKEQVLLNGPKKFMRSIDGGSMVEITLIAQAFLKTLLASRPLDDLPEEIKKNILTRYQDTKKEKKKAIEDKTELRQPEPSL